MAVVENVLNAMIMCGVYMIFVCGVTPHISC